ncbi:hypothetical protein HRI_002641600 [Hibiscus trionum]|uniref:Endonuclease/exonuclease/phosphatase domain-containing protein n=1 Tax=Hibiscus trionum TaxID=183268 RepID=A0A9W7I863_HIBTR|nr:hypothetical protein HRI_002641600 [Hibiscus trionum]
MNLKILSWNVQGYGHWRFLPTARQFLRDSRPDMVVFVEPRISGRNANAVIASLGFPNSHRVEAKGFSGGIWVAWYDSIDVEILINHFQFIHCRVTQRNSDKVVYATTVYASPSSTGRKHLWPLLRNIAASSRSPWILFGDFNATIHSADRKGCASSSTPSKDFQKLLVDFGLRDMGYSGLDFTWSRGHAYARLDRFLCNSYWDEVYPVSSVQHLLRLRSDHRPILLNVGHTMDRIPSQHFRFFSGWLNHDDFSRMVSDNWIPSSSMATTLAHFTMAASTWNKCVFGYIGMKKRILMARLRGIQRALATRHSSFLHNLKSALLIELEKLLDEEELMWKQKSRTDWITGGDRNTTYFHRRAQARKQRNKVTALHTTAGILCDDEPSLIMEAAKFYTTLFSKG